VTVVNSKEKSDILDKVKVIFEDEDLLVLDKPAGLVVHTDERTVEATLSDWLEERYPDLRDIGRPHTLDNERYVPRHGMLTRLDRDTSGVLLIAKNENTFEFISQQFINHTVEKVYIAKVEGSVTGDGLIDAPIGRSRVDPRKWTSGIDIRNTKREAITHYRVLANLNDETIVELSPKTGRTHQLRVHMSHIGHPIIGDKRYNESSASDRMYLHAESIKFTDEKGDQTVFISECDFMALSTF
jgi:23S rRNA pseudouridine1911/1915/1917 synthase